jgi:hypothetical protein
MVTVAGEIGLSVTVKIAVAVAVGVPPAAAVGLWLWALTLGPCSFTLIFNQHVAQTQSFVSAL